MFHAFLGLKILRKICNELLQAGGSGGGGGTVPQSKHIFVIFKVFRKPFFCIFCKPHTYSHPFLPTLVSYKKIWPIYGFVHFSVTKKRAKLGSNLKQLIKENFRFPSSNCDFFLLNTSHTEDMRQKNPN